MRSIERQRLDMIVNPNPFHPKPTIFLFTLHLEMDWYCAKIEKWSMREPFQTQEESIQKQQIILSNFSKR